MIRNSLFKPLLLTFLLMAACAREPVTQSPIPTLRATAIVEAPAEDSSAENAPTQMARTEQQTEAATAIAAATATATTITPVAAATTASPTATQRAATSTVSPSPSPSPTPRPPSRTAVPPTATPLPPTPTPTPTEPTADCQATWFMDRSPEDCPAGPPLTSYTVRQRFQRGLMFWIEETDTYYILFNLGAHPTDARLAFVRLGPLVLKPGASADNRVAEEPPYGLIEPVRGFGLVWRGEVEGLNIDLRQALGWAVEHEVGFQSMFQCQRQETYSEQICYLQNNNGALVVLSSHAVAGNVWWWR